MRNRNTVVALVVAFALSFGLVSLSASNSCYSDYLERMDGAQMIENAGDLEMANAFRNAAALAWSDCVIANNM